MNNTQELKELTEIFLGYDIGNTIGSGHNDALLIDCNSRLYRDITDIDSDVQEVREKARQLISNLLNI